MRTLAVVAASLGTTLVAALYGVGSGYFEQLALDPAERACDLAVRESVKSPASYKRIDSVVSPSEPKVYLKFDGQNGYGATIRGYAACSFRFEAGLLPDSGWFHLDGLSIDGRELSQVELVLATTPLVLVELGSIRLNSTKLARSTP